MMSRPTTRGERLLPLPAKTASQAMVTPAVCSRGSDPRQRRCPNGVTTKHRTLGVGGLRCLPEKSTRPERRTRGARSAGTRRTAPFLSPRPYPHMFARAAAAKVAGATGGGASTRFDGAGFVEWKKLSGCSASGISAGGGAGAHAHRRARDVRRCRASLRSFVCARPEIDSSIFADEKLKSSILSLLFLSPLTLCRLFARTRRSM